MRNIFNSAILGILFGSGLILSCVPGDKNLVLNVGQGVVTINSGYRVDKTTILDHDVLIFPGAYIQTTAAGKIIFNRKVTIIGESQVFSDDVNIEFGPGTLKGLNPCWFGARGDDDIDDTKAIKKTFAVARAYSGSVNIEFPQGKYLVNATLELGNEEPNRKSINLAGSSMSNDALSGASLQWTGEQGGVLLRILNYCVGTIEKMDFNKSGGALLQYNIELLPFNYQVTFRDCSFAGCAGAGSANVNINYNNNLQVSEVLFDNCLFRGYSEDGSNWQTESAVIGGYANTKNFYFQRCSFAGYNIGAINLGMTDILNVENCTFAHNAIDIVCLVCNTLASSNYSEYSHSFFKAAITNNVSFTTLMNNFFYGDQQEDFVITQGGGHLMLINNNFGGMGGEDQVNRIHWDSGPFSHIYSIGNFFRNAPSHHFPFEFSNPRQHMPLESSGDIMGRSLDDLRSVKHLTVPSAD